LDVAQAGLIEIVAFGAAYCWVKNVLGKFVVTENEPFKGRVDGLAKTQCRVVPFFAGESLSDFNEQLALQNPPRVDPILIEGTADIEIPETPIIITPSQ
jgi:hypothetical protein